MKLSPVTLIEQCNTGLLTTAQGTNKRQAMNGSVSLAVSISRDNFAHRLYSVLLIE